MILTVILDTDVARPCLSWENGVEPRFLYSSRAD